jgi:hypothetical protein
VYRRGLINGDYSFSARGACSISAINFTLVILANYLSNKPAAMAFGKEGHDGQTMESERRSPAPEGAGIGFLRFLTPCFYCWHVL